MVGQNSGIQVEEGGMSLDNGSINGPAYTRGLNAQYDAWSSLLETSEPGVGWNWQGVWNYMKKYLSSETLSAPHSQQAAKGAQSFASYHGFSGPVQVTYPDLMYGRPRQTAFVDTIVGLTGINHSKDLNGGTPNYVSITPLTINWHDSDHRSSSATAYLTPVEAQCTNWLTLTTYLVLTKITWIAGSVPLMASGIEFSPASGGSTRYTASARREVIVATGAIQTPALLQHSGIGDSNILGPLGINTLLDLKTVRRNLQEQTMSTLGGSGSSDAIAFPNLYQLFGSQGNATAARIQSSIATWAASQATSGLSAEALQQIFQVQANFITNNNAPIAEITLGILLWNLLPFSRGTVHISVDYFSVYVDLDIQVAAARLTRKMLSTAPFGQVPDNADRGSDADWQSWIQSSFNSVAHPIGTAAMMKPSLGSVVDSKLKVYDTANVRVVDASVLPLQVSAHLSATLYGVAEKAADLIKASHQNGTIPRCI
ncbi:FAD/NAD(P)-binding domain-containing protein [Phlegmacium glaucopus]|nr:FAD/NAD(P)-binding domain-containing protein [Phlegmacium glaucopus]